MGAFRSLKIQNFRKFTYTVCFLFLCCHKKINNSCNNLDYTYCFLDFYIHPFKCLCFTLISTTMIYMRGESEKVLVYTSKEALKTFFFSPLAYI